MRITEITVSATRKINLGNYESADFFVALKAEAESGDSVRSVIVALQKEAKEAVEEAAHAAHAEKKP